MDIRGCLVLEAPIYSSEFASSSSPSGQEGVWGLLGGGHCEAVLCEQSGGLQPGPRLSQQRTCPDGQRSAVLQDTDEMVAGELGRWQLVQQNQGQLGWRPGLPDGFAFCLVITHYLPSVPDKPLS